MKRLRELRIKSGLYAREIGEKFNLSESTILGYERGNHYPSPELLSKFADLFDCTVDYLLGRTNDNSKDKRTGWLAELKIGHKVIISSNCYASPLIKEIDYISEYGNLKVAGLTYDSNGFRLDGYWYYKLHQYSEEAEKEINKKKKYYEMCTFIHNAKYADYDYNCIKTIYNLLKDKDDKND